ncbi:MAG TPA: hypothetical protein VI547_14250 [Anaerolineales bacterium]|nr:hypothetical protein [Anaerolineales bacterium]HLF03140.1 hypothetical protein [Anaerolineales bacterium]
MRPDLLACLDAHWAAHLHCEPACLRNHDTNIVPDPNRTGAEVWLFDKTCVMTAAPPLAQTLKASVGRRSPVVAFEPGPLREVLSTFGLEIHGPEAVMVLADAVADGKDIQWIPISETDSELAAAIRVAADTGIPVTAIPLRHRSARRAAETCGFVLYASVIYIGEKPNL